MPEPSRPATDDDRTDSRGPLDPTAPRADAGQAPSGTAPEPHFAPPDHAGEVGRFGRYRVLKKLGQGGMGAVYLGYDGALERKIALKVMLPQYAADAGARERFLREARSAAKVKSDHVVTIHDVGQEGGVPFIAMEYLLGFPLDQYLRTKGELPLAQVLRVTREAAIGLAAAHALGMIHRDIKPGNLWLEAPNGRVKLLDFGLARPADDDAHLTNSGAVVGTPAYMSPEQGRGLKLDHRSDLFSLGVMLYRLATGRRPFTGDTTMAVLTSLAVDTPTPVRELNPQLPPALDAVITKLLAKTPAERFQSANEVVEALRAIETGSLPVVVALPVPAFAVGAQTQNVWAGIEDSRSIAVPLATGPVTELPPVPAPKPRKASKAPMLLAGAALLVACAVLAAVILQPWKKNEPVAVNPGDAPNPPTPPVAKDPPVPAAPDPDRKTAERVLSVGGTVKVNGGALGIADANGLPKARFTLTTVALRDNKTVTDADLATFKECTALTSLDLNNTKTSNAGVVHLKDCRNLTFLRLRQTLITDAGLALLNGHKSLTTLDVRVTQVTAVALERFSKATPQCRIDWDGGVIEPTVTTDPDRAAAEYVLSVGGTVRVNDDPRHIKSATDLPKERFTIVSANLHSRSKLTDADLQKFKGCKGLAHLALQHTPVSDAGLAHCAGIESLTSVHLTGTKVSATGVEALKKALPRCLITWDGGTTEPTAVADPDRVAAEYVLSIGGTVGVDGKISTIKAAADLPKDRFTLTTVMLLNPAAMVTDAGLAVFKDCKNLTTLRVDYAKIGDAGLAHFAECKGLKTLDLYNVAVTDAGLAHLKDCKGLTQLTLTGTKAVTDAGLAHFKECKSLTRLQLSGTKVTPTMIEEFRKALPQCKITYDGGAIPTKK